MTRILHALNALAEHVTLPLTLGTRERDGDQGTTEGQAGVEGQAG
jgi:hypothetical protein